LLDALRARAEACGPDLRTLARELLEHAHDGRIKLYVTERALGLRHAQAELFAHGAYIPLEAVGAGREHLIAFARTLGEREIVVAVPRLTLRLAQGHEQPPLGAVWADTRLVLPDERAGGRWRDRFTGALLSASGGIGEAHLVAADVFRHFPVALLERVER
jgi:(1->4)-alpha-D-glucan 1-alpha-D-glucosylmutase